MHSAITGANSPASAVGFSIVGAVNIGSAKAALATTAIIQCNHPTKNQRNQFAIALSLFTSQILPPLSLGTGLAATEAIQGLQRFSGAGICASLTAYQFYAVAITAKVCGVERQQSALAVSQHGRDDVGVVNLASSYRNRATQFD